MNNTDYTNTHKPKMSHQRRAAGKRALKSLACPCCGWHRLIDTGRRTESLTYPPDSPGYDEADYYQKCSKCNTEVGIRKI